MDPPQVHSWMLNLWNYSLWYKVFIMLVLPPLLLLNRLSRVWLCATPQTAAHQAPPSMGFSRQEHWSGSLLPSQHVGSNFPLLFICKYLQFSSIQFSSVAQSCLTLCDPMNRSTPGLPVHRRLPEFTQTHVHWIGDAIQPSHPLIAPFSSCSPSFPGSGNLNLTHFPMSQFSSGGQSIGASVSASVIPMNIQDWSPLGWAGCISLPCKGTLKSFLQHHSSKASTLLKTLNFSRTRQIPANVFPKS